MKKWVLIIIGLYFVFAIILILTAPKKSDSVKILVRKQSYSQVITSKEETFDILIYISDNQTFLTEIQTINDARIISDDSELQISIKAIDDLLLTTKYQDTEYHCFRMRFDVSNYASEGLELIFSQAKLAIGYKNYETVVLEIGKVFLYWKTIDKNPDFDFYRLSGVYGHYQEAEMLQGIAIGFDQFIENEIQICSIRTGNEDIWIDINHKMDYIEDDNQTVYQRLGANYQPFDIDESIATNPVSVFPNVINIFPIKYQNQTSEINRFPLMIDYVIKGEKRTFIIDDFIFKSESYILSEDTKNVVITDYRYRN